MSWWVYLAIWVLLALSSLAYLGFLLFRVFKKGIAVVRVADPVLVEGKKLAVAVTTKAVYEKPESNLLDDVNLHIVERAKMAKTRKLKAELRQRRLIEHLKDFNSQESELNNGRP